MNVIDRLVRARPRSVDGDVNERSSNRAAPSTVGASPSTARNMYRRVVVRQRRTFQLMRFLYSHWLSVARPSDPFQLVFVVELLRCLLGRICKNGLTFRLGLGLGSGLGLWLVFHRCTDRG